MSAELGSYLRLNRPIGKARQRGKQPTHLVARILRHIAKVVCGQPARFHLRILYADVRFRNAHVRMSSAVSGGFD
jgi:hypothetical protein